MFRYDTNFLRAASVIAVVVFIVALALFGG